MTTGSLLEALNKNLSVFAKNQNKWQKNKDRKDQDQQ